MKRVTRRQIEQYPMLLSLVLIVTGIILGEALVVHYAIAFVVCAVLFLLAWSAERWRAGLIVVSLFFVGVGLCNMSSEKRVSSARGPMVVSIERITSQQREATMGEARVLARYDERGWSECDMNIRFRCDSSCRVEEGERLCVDSWLRPYYSTSASSYRRNMARQGFVGELRFAVHDILDSLPSSMSLGATMRHYATRQVAKLQLPEAERGVVEAMSVGSFYSLPKSLREEYSQSGMAHLLAISGLHVAFIFLITSHLFRWLVLLRRGQLWLTAVVIVTVVGYAIMSGLSASVVRSAIMFVIFQLLNTISQRKAPIENLSLTAIIMLLYDSSMLYSISFQLSFVAVLAILVWGVPLLSLLSGSMMTYEGPRREPRYRSVLRRVKLWLCELFTISLVATLAVIPLTCYYFGTLSLWSVVTSPLMVPLCGGVVCTIFVWILFPIPILAPMLGAVVGKAVGLMNDVAHWCSEVGWLNASWRMSAVECIMVYVVLITMTLLVHKKTISPTTSRSF